MPVFILEHTEKKKRKRLEVDKESILVGRRTDAEIALADTSVSKRHVLIKRTDLGYSFRDLGSQNGTFVNDVRRTSGLLRHRDVIRVGRIQITFINEQEAEKEKPATSAKTDAGEKSPPPGAPSPAPDPGPSSAATPPTARGEGDPLLLEADAGFASGPATTLVSPRSLAAPRPAPPRRAPLTLWIGLGLFGIGFGMVLGLLGSFFDEGEGSDEDAAAAPVASRAAEEGEPAESGAAPEESASPAIDHGAPEFSLGSLPGLAPDPLGSYASPEESARVLYRLYLDLLERPPTRAELRSGLPLDHRARWNLLQRALPPDRRGGRGVDATFLAFLDRLPDEREREVLDNLTHDALEHLGLWLTATREYRSSTHRRDRNLRQLARSLIVDLQDRAPFGQEAVSEVEDAILDQPDLGQVARVLAGSVGVAPAGAGELESAIAEEFFRFLQRPPQAGELLQLVEGMEKHPEGLRWLRQTLALAEEYRRY